MTTPDGTMVDVAYARTRDAASNILIQEKPRKGLGWTIQGIGLGGYAFCVMFWVNGDSIDTICRLLPPEEVTEST